MRGETDEPEIAEWIAGLDVGKAEVVCCVPVPGPEGQRMHRFAPSARPRTIEQYAGAAHSGAAGHAPSAHIATRHAQRPLQQLFLGHQPLQGRLSAPEDDPARVRAYLPEDLR
jgi:hypothetical protein